MTRWIPLNIHENYSQQRNRPNAKSFVSVKVWQQTKSCTPFLIGPLKKFRKGGFSRDGWQLEAQAFMPWDPCRALKLRRLTGTARVRWREQLAVRFNGGTQRQCLVVHVNVLDGVSKTEVWQNDVEYPVECARFFGESHLRTLQHVGQHQRYRHCTQTYHSRHSVTMYSLPTEMSNNNRSLSLCHDCMKYWHSKLLRRYIQLCICN